MRTRRATARSSDVRRRLPPGAVLALERHGVTELRVGTATAAAEPGRRRGGAGGAGAGVGAGGPRQLGLLAVIAVALRGSPGWRRCSSVVARGSVGVGRGASAARVAPPLLGAAASDAAAASASAVEPLASSVATSAVTLLVVRLGIMRLQGGRGAAHGGRRRAERGRAREQPLLGRRKGDGDRGCRSAVGDGARGCRHDLQRRAGGARGWSSGLGLGRLRRGRRRGGGGRSDGRCRGAAAAFFSSGVVVAVSFIPSVAVVALLGERVGLKRIGLQTWRGEAGRARCTERKVISAVGCTCWALLLRLLPTLGVLRPTEDLGRFGILTAGSNQTTR